MNELDFLRGILNYKTQKTECSKKALKRERHNSEKPQRSDSYKGGLREGDCGRRDVMLKKR